VHGSSSGSAPTSRLLTEMKFEKRVAREFNNMLEEAARVVREFAERPITSRHTELRTEEETLIERVGGMWVLNKRQQR
jgi:hypothetical protein